MTTNTKEYQRAWYAAHREERKAYFREYNRKRKLEMVSNPKLLDLREDYKTPTTEDFKAIPHKELSYSQKYYIENREKIREQQKQRRIDNRRKEKARNYYAAHREHLCELQRKAYAKKQREKKLSKTFFGRLYLKVFG